MELLPLESFLSKETRVNAKLCKKKKKLQLCLQTDSLQFRTITAWNHFLLQNSQADSLRISQGKILKYPSENVSLPHIVRNLINN